MRTAVQVTVYLKESDKWHRKPLHIEILRMLREEKVAGASAFHAVAGFVGRNHVHTSGLVEAGGDLPVMVIFIDFVEHVDRVLPRVLEMAPDRLIVRENVVVEREGSLE